MEQIQRQAPPFEIDDANMNFFRSIPRLRLGPSDPKIPKSVRGPRSLSDSPSFSCLSVPGSPVSPSPRDPSLLLSKSPIFRAISSNSSLETTETIDDLPEPFGQLQSEETKFVCNIEEKPDSKKRTRSMGLGDWKKFYEFVGLYLEPFSLTIDTTLALYHVYGGDTAIFQKLIRRELLLVTGKDFLKADEIENSFDLLVREKCRLFEEHLVQTRIEKDVLNNQL